MSNKELVAKKNIKLISEYFNDMNNYSEKRVTYELKNGNYSWIKSYVCNDDEDGYDLWFKNVSKKVGGLNNWRQSPYFEDELSDLCVEYKSEIFTVYITFNEKKMINKEITITRDDLVTHDDDLYFNIEKDDLTITFASVDYKKFYIVDILLEKRFNLYFDVFLDSMGYWFSEEGLEKMLRPKWERFFKANSLEVNMDSFGHDKLKQILKPIKSIHAKNRNNLKKKNMSYLTLLKNKKLK